MDWLRRAKSMALARGVTVSQMLRDVVDNPGVALEPQPTLIDSVPRGAGVAPPLSVSALPGVAPSALDAAGGHDPVMAEVVGDAPKHWHQREAVSTQWVNGQKVTTYRCKVCGVPL